eukprot:TRINITY_DN2247_c0_g2_i2.p1 TRINITY_DN2247_c0_g2~~TRINITY_DN2247_c0_g2_i2.p1  ORF type:complete len:403 (+),score=74.81 TRINITY_DN2247_c0_g2_i2:232-1440(+)
MAKIIIIGAGLGGLAFAQGLKLGGIDCEIFERDPSKEFRPQGFRIRVGYEGSGALKKVLPQHLWELFQKTCAITKIGQTRANPLTGEIITREDGIAAEARSLPPTALPSDVYSADRTTLRYLLMEDLNINFGKEFEKYTLLDDGKIRAHFTDGTSVDGDLLVACDGLHSKVRKQFLPSQIPVDTRGRCIYGKTPVTPLLHSSFPPQFREWITMFSTPSSPPLTLFLEPVSFENDPNITSGGKFPSVKDYIYWVLLSDLDTFKLSTRELLSLSKEDIYKLSLSLTSDWSPSIRALLEQQSQKDSSTLCIATALPDIKLWETGKITFVGDSIHVMSPTGGVGANTAFRDAALLSECLKKGVTTENINHYENEMRVYAKEAIMGSYRGGKRMYNQPDFDQCHPIY